MKSIDKLIKSLREAKEELSKASNASSGFVLNGSNSAIGMSKDDPHTNDPHKNDPHENDPHDQDNTDKTVSEDIKHAEQKDVLRSLFDMHGANGSMEKMSVSKNGQWSLEKADKKEFGSYDEAGKAIDSAMSEADFNPKTKHPLEPTAGMPAGKKSGERTTSTGFKIKAVEEPK